MRKADAAKPVAVTATMLFASLLGAWFWFKIQQGIALGVTADAQIVRLAAAALLFAPFLVLIYLVVKPQAVLRSNSSQGSVLFAGLAFVWLVSALFLSLLVGFAPF